MVLARAEGRARFEHRRAGSLQGGRGGGGCNGRMNHSVVAGERQGAPWALPRWGPPQYYVQGLDVSQSVQTVARGRQGAP